jgi:hypothetical protein
MLVVDIRATGMDILFRSMLLGALVVFERVGNDDDSDEASVRFMRLVTARARDMTMN